MEFNPDPIKQATELFFSKRLSPNHPPLFFNGSVVTKVNEQKHLGLFLDKKMSFEMYITEKIKTAQKGISVIKKT